MMDILMSLNENQSTWNYKKSRDFYNIHGWGNSYFDINKNGEITVKRSKYLSDIPLAINDIVNEIKNMGIKAPILLRFTDIIQNRAERIIKAFADAKKELDYAANYSLIYPIKVNQHKTVIDSFLKLKNDNHGLEAGSKAELLAVLASIKDNKTPIICNGYKDKDYIRIALIARKLGRNITIVIEKMIEATYIIELSNELNVTPLLGVRFRLALVLAGKWSHSGGEKSKFGLNTTQLLELITLLKRHNLFEHLHLLHCHQGSQIANLRDIQYYITELSTVYIELHKLGVNLKVIDIGGGLAVDYEGSRTRSFNSTNYTLSEYANTILTTIKKNAEANNIPVPDIYSESGRAVVAHHAVLITDIVDVEPVVGEDVPEVKSNDEDLIELDNLLDSFDKLSINEIYSSSIVAIDSIQNLFTKGLLSLEKRAIAEQLFSHIKLRILKKLNRSFRSHRELYDLLDEDLAKKVIVNFSLFQSMPDMWAIGQLFPVMPLTQLNNEPKMRAIIEDITCDSDGKISCYMDYQGNEPSLKLPIFDKNNPYLLAVFLVGAYQEIMGNLHNLFGPVTVFDITLDGKNGFTINDIHEGFSAQDSLQHVGFDQEYLLAHFKKYIFREISNKKEQPYLFNILEKMLNANTYLN
ncbi:MAG TPA: biosynthetic arginine decarboxylase [Burkholderiales bacterium]|nr:biosynthetic arginine decarboxylase [Burkholderiales bacterium]